MAWQGAGGEPEPESRGGGGAGEGRAMGSSSWISSGCRELQSPACSNPLSRQSH